MSEALKEAIDLVDPSLQQVKEENSIISVRSRKKASISVTGTSTQFELSTYHSNRYSVNESLKTDKHSPDFTTKNLDILVVDDSGLNRKMLCRLLRASGYVFDVAEDGLLALNKVKEKMSVAANGLEKGSFSVILMDYIMPNMDGPTATKAIRDLGYTAPIFGK
jgi:PleD family two-component response regulator